MSLMHRCSDGTVLRLVRSVRCASMVRRLRCRIYSAGNSTNSSVNAKCKTHARARQKPLTTFVSSRDALLCMPIVSEGSCKTQEKDKQQLDWYMSTRRTGHQGGGEQWCSSVAHVQDPRCTML